MATDALRAHPVRRASGDLEALVRSYHRDRRPELLDEIVESFEWLVMLCVKRARWHDDSVDDLAQIARMGLLDAIERFDPTRGFQFRTFAEATMIGTLRHHQRSSLQVTVPRSVQHLNGECRSAVDRLTATLGRTPTTTEVADHVGIGRNAVADALAVDALFHPMPLSTDESAGTRRSRAIEERICVDDARIESTADRAEIQDALSSLPDRQRMIIFLHYYDGRTQAEIGARLGISQVQVSRLMTTALDAIRCRWAAVPARAGPPSPPPESD